MNEMSRAARSASELPTLERWLTGPRIHGLPAPISGHAAPKLSFEFFPPRTDALEAQLWSWVG